jgi:hypothetical protein
MPLFFGKFSGTSLPDFRRTMIKRTKIFVKTTNLRLERLRTIWSWRAGRNRQYNRLRRLEIKGALNSLYHLLVLRAR